MRDVLKREKFDKYLKRLQKTPEGLVADYLHYANVIEPASVPDNAVRDSKDRRVLAAAVGGKATCIVSGDDDLLILKQFAGITILNVKDFIRLVTPDDAA